jgi:hypothetical protein
VGWLLAPLLVVAWLAVVARPIGRRILDRHDDRAALQAHRRVLDRLRDIDGATGMTSGTDVGRPHVRVLGSGTTELPPTSATSPPARPGPLPAPLSPLRRSGGRPRIRFAFAVAIAALFIVTGFVAVGMAQRDRPTRAAASHIPPAYAPHATTTPSTAPPANPSVPAVRLIGADTTTAGYAVTATPAVVTVVANAPCWVQARPGDAGTTAMFEGTMTAGARHTFSNPAGIWLRLGNPGAVTLVVNGVSIDLPAAGHGTAPFDVLFRTSSGT